MVARSEQAFLSMAEGRAPKETTVERLEYLDVRPFFVDGDREMPLTQRG